MRWLVLPPLLLMMMVSCDRPKAASPAATRPVVPPTIASLVPAATDILVGIGAADHLVAISNYDSPRVETEGLPKVGDYQTLDWERLSTLRPDVLITFQAADRLPAGMRQRADEMGVRLVNIRTETLEDIFAEMAHLGEVAGERDKAAEAQRKLKSDLEAVRSAVAGRPRVRTLILRDERGAGAVGTGNFLNDVLEIAGGTNVLSVPGWPTVDREQLFALDPDVIVQLLSGVPAHVEQSARDAWRSLPNLRAVKEGRVVILNRWYSQQSGLQVSVLARELATALHPGLDSGGAETGKASP